MTGLSIATRRFALTAGCLVASLGVLVILGWLVGSRVLVRIAPGFIAMRFNTGLCFLVAGVGLVAVSRRWRRVAWGSAVFLVLAGGLIGVEFLAGADWASDTWLWADLLDGVVEPGRMHETTAAGFVLTGIGLGLFAWSDRHGWRVTFATTAIAAAAGLGLLGVFGYVAGLSMVSRTAELVGFGMALHTALGFLVLGLGAVAQAMSTVEGDSGKTLAWRAPVAAVAMFALGLVLWQALTAEERDRVQAATVEAADRAFSLIGARVRLSELTLDAVAASAGPLDETTGFWLEHDPALLAVGRFSTDGRAVELIGRSQDDAVLLSKGGSGSVALRDGSIGLVWSEDDTRVLIGSTRLFADALEESPGYSASVIDEEANPVFFTADAEDPTSDSPLESRPLGVEPVEWSILVWPTPGRIAELSSPLPELALAGAVTVALLCGLAVAFASSAQGGRRHAERIGAALAREVETRRRAQDELEAAAERLSRSNRELQEFAFVASHDLQEPLRKIQAFGDRLRDRAGAGLDEKSADYLGRMLEASRRMQTLINDLLAFSRLTIRAQPFVEVDLNQVVAHVVEDLDLAVTESGAEIAIGALPVIDAEPTQMRQLMQNLIGNAIKYRHPDRAPVITISTVASTNGSVGIRVEDNGIGFEPHQSERIFQLFQRLHGRSEYEGTGMGLAIGRRIAERHGGTLVAEASPDVGSTFLLTLPIHQRPDEDSDES